ncbi:uncharacterized protein LOC132551292 [Ylistrum balloti]|uniref:uncharacterized protein LOC132551292 n=1 Tax=Ylistrum balloti TaxID=509963 RepID=UPI002905AF6E|nr:uncharacterized protein LOC132551292 [Ylistrum balloti]
MLYDTWLMCVCWLCVLAGLRMVNTSRPAYYDSGSKGSWLTSEEIRKARARWKAAMMMKTTDDEDLVLPNDNGSGMMQKDGGNHHLTRYTGSVSRLHSSTCCRLGRVSATRRKPCHSGYYTNQLKVKLRRYRLYRYKQRLKLLRSRYGNKYRQNIMDKYQKCALRRHSRFQKCCNAVYYHKKRRHRNWRMYARYRNSLFKRKRRRH